MASRDIKSMLSILEPIAINDTYTLKYNGKPFYQQYNYSILLFLNDSKQISPQLRHYNFCTMISSCNRKGRNIQVISFTNGTPLSYNFCKNIIKIRPEFQNNTCTQKFNIHSPSYLCELRVSCLVNTIQCLNISFFSTA